MVNFKKLASRAQVLKDQVDKQVEKQGGTDAVKEKAQRMKEAAGGPGKLSDKAKAAAQVAKEKPNPAAPTAGDQVSGGGSAPPQARPDDPAANVPGETASEPVPDPDAPTAPASERPSER